MKQLICIPTYNENENIKELIQDINSLNLPFDILIIDDNSPDGTALSVNELQNRYKNLHLIKRAKKQGLASAYQAGFKFALDNNYSFVGEMDADFSHHPRYLHNIHKLIQNGQHEVILGSRYIKGGGTKNWSVLRRLISKFGNLYAKTLLNINISDMTGGFNFWSTHVLKSIHFDEIVSEGYVFQIEIKYRACKKDFNMIEFPIIFEDRRVGQTKMTKKIAFEALYMVPYLRLIV